MFEDSGKIKFALVVQREAYISKAATYQGREKLVAYMVST